MSFETLPPMADAKDEHRLVGGPLDGKWRHIRVGCQFYEFFLDALGTYRRITYRRESDGTFRYLGSKLV